MVAGRLHEKNGNFYIILDYKDETGKRKNKWISTGLPVKGNKKKAEDLLLEARQKFEVKPATDPEEILFSDYLEKWLLATKPSIELTTYASYLSIVNATVAPYFKKKQIKLTELKTKDIQEFYNERLKSVSARTVIHYHVVIHKALKHATKAGMIPVNPAQHVDRPKVNKYVGNYYDENELKTLFDIIKGDSIELPILFGAYYGLRRSEVIGLQWSAIDLDKNTLAVKHTVVQTEVDGKKTIVAKNRAKNKSSLRTLPLMPMFKERLIVLKKEQANYRKLCGNSYCTDYLGYINVNEVGNLLTPEYVSRRFQLILANNGLKKIRFHDLRHSYVKPTPKKILRNLEILAAY